MTTDTRSLARPRDHGLGLRYVLGVILAFGAVCAIGGGIYGMSGAAGVPTAWLAGSGFPDYLAPGLILCFVVGGSWLAAAIAVFANASFARHAARGAGAVMLGWIVVQVAIIGFRSWLQPAVFGAAILVIALAEASLRDA